MKRGLALIVLCLVLPALLSGCGDAAAAGEDPAAETAGEEAGSQAEDSGEAAGAVETVLTVSEAVDFLMSLPPQTLGLAGTQMSGYQVYPATEVVSVDGLSCSKLSVYRAGEETGTNEIQGIYLLSRGEERRLFRLEEDGKEVTELALPQLAAASPAGEETPPPDQDES